MSTARRSSQEHIANLDFYFKELRTALAGLTPTTQTSMTPSSEVLSRLPRPSVDGEDTQPSTHAATQAAPLGLSPSVSHRTGPENHFSEEGDRITSCCDTCRRGWVDGVTTCNEFERFPELLRKELQFSVLALISEFPGELAQALNESPRLHPASLRDALTSLFDNQGAIQRNTLDLWRREMREELHQLKMSILKGLPTGQGFQHTPKDAANPSSRPAFSIPYRLRATSPPPVFRHLSPTPVAVPAPNLSYFQAARA